IAFVGTLHGNPVRSYSQPDLWVVDAAAGSAPRNLTAGYDFDINGGIGGDQAAPRGENMKPVVWSADSESLLVVSAEHGSANFRRVAIGTGKVDAVIEEPQDVMGYSATPDGSKIAATISTATTIGDVFLIDAGNARRLTHVNEPLFKDIGQSEPEEFWYTSFDGKKSQGWILKRSEERR